MKNLIFKITFLLLLMFSSQLKSQTWIEQPASPPAPALFSVSTVSRSCTWIGGLNGTILYTSTGGANWVYRNNATVGSNAVHLICGIDSLTALCATRTTLASLFRTTDKGVTWNFVLLQNGGWFRDVRMSNALTGYVYGDPVGGRWTIYRTTNAGAGWDSSNLRLFQTGGELGNPNAMCVSGNSIWLGTNNSKIYYSQNGGLFWLSQPISYLNTYSISVNLPVGFSGGEQSSRSSDGGFTWQPFPLPGAGPVYSFVNSTGRWWYCRQTVIFYSVDGMSFSPQYNSPVSGIYNQLSMTFTLNDNNMSSITGWGVTNNGAISKYEDNTIGIHQISNEVPEGFKLYQNYPNPFNPTTKIKFDVSQTSAAQTFLFVYDILGKKICSLVNNALNPGTYEVEWDASNFPTPASWQASGIYYYTLKSGNYSETKKMILLK